VEITPPSTDDSDTLADRWVELARDQRRYGSHLHGRANRSAIREAILNRIVAGDLLVARLRGSIVGFVMFTVEEGRYAQDETTGLVENLYVDPEVRRRGIGSALLGAAEERLEESGATVVTIEAMAANEGARAVYAASGYSPHRIELEKSIENDTP